MKTIKEVDFYRSVGVEYTHTPYQGASAFYYRWRYLPTDKTGQSVVYGVSETGGTALVDYWNGVNPTVWEYWIDLAANANNPKFMTDN